MVIFPYFYNTIFSKKMGTLILDQKQEKIMDEIPSMHDFSKFYFYLNESKADNYYIGILNSLFGLNDNILSDWLNISTKTLRTYKNKSDVVLKENLKEHVVSIIALYKHGIEVFGDKENFEKWLTAKNMLLDNKAPIEFLDMISGIKFIDSRLIAMEFGENV